MLTSPERSTGSVLAISTLAGLLAGRIFYLEKAKKINYKKLVAVVGSGVALSLGFYALHDLCGSKPGLWTDLLATTIVCPKVSWAA